MRAPRRLGLVRWGRNGVYDWQKRLPVQAGLPLGVYRRKEDCWLRVGEKRSRVLRRILLPSLPIGRFLGWPLGPLGELRVKEDAQCD
jgi:hypothetical protein